MVSMYELYMLLYMVFMYELYRRARNEKEREKVRE